jgi:hypothetical protein
MSADAAGTRQYLLDEARRAKEAEEALLAKADQGKGVTGGAVGGAGAQLFAWLCG